MTREPDNNFNIKIYPKVKRRIKSTPWIKGSDPSLFRELIRDVIARPEVYPFPRPEDHKGMGEEGLLTTTIDKETRDRLSDMASACYASSKGFASLCLFRAWLRLEKEEPDRIVKGEKGLIFERQEKPQLP